jgi:hypothetical protein
MYFVNTLQLRRMPTHRVTLKIWTGWKVGVGENYEIHFVFVPTCRISHIESDIRSLRRQLKLLLPRCGSEREFYRELNVTARFVKIAEPTIVAYKVGVQKLERVPQAFRRCLIWAIRPLQRS